MNRTQLFTMVCVGIALAGGSAMAEQIDNPQYTAWSKFAVGSSQTLDRSIDAGGRKMTITELRILKSITADAVTLDLQVTMAMNGMTMPSNSRPEVINAKIEKSQEPKQVGEETINAAGKSFKCKIYTMSANSARGTNADAKVWISDEVPGAMVKTVASSPQGQATSMLTKFEAK